MLRVAPLAVLALVLAAGPAAVRRQPSPDVDVYCPAVASDCEVSASDPGSPGGPGGSSGGSGGGSGVVTCRTANGVAVPCYHPDFGWFNPYDHCYYKATEGDLGYYELRCPSGAGSTTWYRYLGVVRLDAPPPRPAAGAPTPAMLAAEAVSRLPIRGPEIGIAPAPDGSGLVGLPVWMWTEVTPQTWGPISATASVPGLSVTATARAERVVWDMGDGHAVTCTGPGTAYRESYGGSPSPDCGYRYAASSRSRPGGRYTVTATTTWHITWTGGGQSGELTVTRASSTTVDIAELQVVIS